MSGRKMIKWLPFDAVIPAEKTVRKLEEKRNLKKMPVLSEEQIIDNENNILYSYNNKEIVKLTYFKEGKYFLIESIVTYINIHKKSITLKNNLILYFSQIIKISLI